MRPYCTSRLCNTAYEGTCDGCRLEAACNAMAIGLAMAGAMAAYVLHVADTADTPEETARWCIAQDAGYEYPAPPWPEHWPKMSFGPLRGIVLP